MNHPASVPTLQLRLQRPHTGSYLYPQMNDLNDENEHDLFLFFLLFHDGLSLEAFSHMTLAHDG